MPVMDKKMDKDEGKKENYIGLNLGINMNNIHE